MLGPDRFRLRAEFAPEPHPVAAAPRAASWPPAPVRGDLGRRLAEGLAARSRAKEVTPSPRPDRDASTGPRPDQHGNSTGLASISLRLSGAKLGQRLTAASAEADSHLEPAAVAVTPGFPSLGEALKRTKLQHVQPAPPPEGPTFQRQSLGNWMELAAKHQPANLGSRARAVPGGLQHAYARAVRDYLTERSLHQGAEDSATPREGESSLHLKVIETHVTPQGILVHAEVIAASAAACPNITSGDQIRLLLHQKHPAISGGRDEKLVFGVQLRVCGFHVLSSANSARGKLLLPLSVTIPCIR